ncbi:MAG: hypothetical protein KF802_07410 [Bdellovibrionaceae bacterium]|nr:hypothetical protein [Pseudobdellovibrionaceae bacterium]
MADFFFEGRIPTSKSLLNRALILKSHAPEGLQLLGGSDAEDVVFLRKSLGKIEDGKEFYLGDGGTTLRFFALRAAREKGQFTLKVSERLFRRPHGALKEILEGLGVSLEPGHNQFVMKSRGWLDPGQALSVPTGDSSQFASAVVLNAWGLPYDLDIAFSGGITSESYFRMTLDLCRRAGMTIEETDKGLRIPARQRIQLKSLILEPDFSSMFSLAALAALHGRAEFLSVRENPLQPDARFIDLLREMGVPVEWNEERLTVGKAASLKAVTADLALCPDLVPVLSVLCAFAEGRSVLRGAPQLRHKESDRIISTAGLLRRMGIDVDERPDGLEIEGSPGLAPKSFPFDPDKDHRLAMAAGILIRMGWDVRVSEPAVVDKSFPEFWSLLHAGPHLIVGHRGAGKTSFARRLSGVPVRDIDEEIEKNNGQKIFDFFRDRGEEVFRQTELATLRAIAPELSPRTWVSLGAGLRLEEIEKVGEIFWLRRDTDRDGRVFLDRPRLDPSSDPLGEFRTRARPRESLYARHADRVYTVPEGLWESDEIERRIIAGDLRGTGGAVTMFPRHRRTIPQLGAGLYELRDDLLDDDELHSLFLKLPTEKILYSVRRRRHIPDEILASDCWIDWGLDEFYPEKEFVQHLSSRLILSSHGTLKDALLDFRLYSKFNVHWKMSPIVESYEDLREGHLWWAQDPQHRSFLPRSAEGRWAWYRLWMKGRMKLNFWREDMGSSLDQPTLSQWLATPFSAESFAAVLGSPVHHSWSPAEHRSFFAAHDMPFWAIDVREGEWNKAFPFLRELGLRFAAVTSPLKGRAFRACEPSSLAEELGSVNTLAWDESIAGWRGHNTDLEGLAEAVTGLPPGPIVVWGGGGTLPVLGRVLPGASAYSATGGHLRQGSPPLAEAPSTLVWAAPRGGDLKWPPDSWAPEVVLDLNYKEDSPGREYALRCKARYLSGEKMFREQARGQRQYWQKFLKG